MGAPAEMEQALVVATKLRPPSQPRGLEVRRELIDRIERSTEQVVVVSAPAGYGKTTLLAQYASASERPVAWVSLDAADDDPTALVLGIATALDLSRATGDLYRRRIASRSDVRRIVSHLVEVLCRRPGAVIILDDAHHLQSSASREVLALLAEWIPDDVRMVIATREAPPIATPRLRARGRLLELTHADLALDTTAAAALLTHAGVGLEPERLAALLDRVEGWPAGLYLAALSVRGRADPNGFVDEFAGDHRSVVEYLTEEVLARQDADRLRFLMRTSMLDRFNSALCDAVLQRTGSAQDIDDLVRDNLFVIQLDDRREWYRYHHLFAEALRAELLRRESKLAGPIHRRASIWFERHGTIPEAVTHAFAAGDRQRAARLVADNALMLFHLGMLDTVVGWLDEFADGDLERHPPLAVINAWAGALTADRTRARQSLELIRGLAYDGPMPNGESCLDSAGALLRAVYGWDGVTQMRADSELACSYERPGTVPHARAAAFYGASLTLCGNRDEAAVFLEAAVALPEAVPNGAVLALGLLGIAAIDDGHLALADARLGEALQLVEHHTLGEYLTSGSTFAGLSLLCLATGSADDARLYLDRTLALLPSAVAWPWWSVYLRVVAARAAIGLSDLGLASDLLEVAHGDAARYPDSGRLPELVSQQQRVLADVYSGRGRLVEPLTPTERRVLELLPTHLSVDEIARMLHISKNTAKSHLKRIYRKLDVGTRSEAVARTRALGLERSSR